MQMTRNILRTFRSATPEQYDAGVNWYADKHTLATTLAGGDSWLGGGVFAAYSPLTPWWRNVELATDSLTSGVARTDTLPNNYRAAGRMLAGAHPLDVLGGTKTRNFASAIALNGETDLVTVDSIAYSAAINSHTPAKKASIGVRVYREVAEAYTRAAARVDLSPCQTQAVVWVVWRDAHPNLAAVRGSGS